MAANEQLQKVRQDITKKLHEPNAVTNVMGQIEAKTGVDRFFLFCGVAGILGLYMVFGHFAELLCNAIAFALPAYLSIKAIETHSKEDDVQWLTYWVVIGILNVFEFAGDEIESWCPVYWLIKCVFALWLQLPATRGAAQIYTRFIKPFAQKHADSKIGAAGAKIGEGMSAAGDAVSHTASKFE